MKGTCSADCTLQENRIGFHGADGAFTLSSTAIARNVVGAILVGGAYELDGIKWDGNADDAVVNNSTRVFADADSSAPSTFSESLQYTTLNPQRNVTVDPLAAAPSDVFLSGSDSSFGALQQVRTYVLVHCSF